MAADRPIGRQVLAIARTISMTIRPMINNRKIHSSRYAICQTMFTLYFYLISPSTGDIRVSAVRVCADICPGVLERTGGAAGKIGLRRQQHEHLGSDLLDGATE